MAEIDAPWIRFHVGERCFALPLPAVAEVTAATPPRLIPLVPLELGGIVNLRGEPLPVVDGGALLSSGSGDRRGKLLVLENGPARIGVLVGQVVGLERGLAGRPLLEEAGERETCVRWVADGRGRLGLVDPEGLLERAEELLTGKCPRRGEQPCPSGF